MGVNVSGLARMPVAGLLVRWARGKQDEELSLPRNMLAGVTAIVCTGFVVAFLLRHFRGMGVEPPLRGALVTFPPLIICWVWRRLRWPGRQWVEATAYVAAVALAQYALEVNITGVFYVVPVVGVLYRNWRPSVYATLLSLLCVALFGLPGTSQVIAPLQLWAHLVLQVGLMFMYVTLAMLARRADESLTRARMTEQMAHQWAVSIEARDRYTGGHVERVTAYAMELAPHVEGLGMDLQTFRLASILHDIGKIAVPDQVLNKPGRLTPEEFAVMQSHAVSGYDMLLRTGAPPAALGVVRHHHERWDGKGYPDRLAGEAIPMAARVLAVADTFDAMTSDRPYRAALAPETAREEILRCAGTHFDPLVVEAFRKVYPRWVELWKTETGRLV